MKSQKIRLALLSLSALASAASLTACRTTADLRLPDKARFYCADDPARPEGSGEAYTLPDGRVVHEVTDAEAADYLKAQRGVAGDCRSKLDWLRSYFFKDG